MSRRTERLGSIIRDELAAIILHELDDPRLQGMPSITRVKVAEDLSTADVFVTIMGTPGQQTAALNALKHSAGMMRSKLTKALSTRVTPFLNFKLDEKLKKELEVLELLETLSREQRAKEQAALGEDDRPDAELPDADLPEAALADADRGDTELPDAQRLDPDGPDVAGRPDPAAGKAPGTEEEDPRA